MGKIIQEYLDGDRIYVCSKCHIHISNYKYRISKNFRGGLGQAFLFEKGINYHVGEPEDKDMMTGKHTVQDVICNGCNKIIGWKYVLRNVLIHPIRLKHIDSRRNIKRERLQQKDIPLEELNGYDFIIQYIQKYIYSINELLVNQK